MTERPNPFNRSLLELKRRRVFRVAAAYAVAGWLVVEVSATILPVLDAPAWTTRLIIVMALLGFPVAVVLAWAFDITPEGVKRTTELTTAGESDVSRLPGGQAGRIAVAGAVLVLALAGAGWWMSASRGSGDRPAPHSIAVLPFVNMSGDEENEYFSDGITEELLDHLAKLSGLQVAARTSSFAFKARELPVPEIARQLGVAVVLEGSVRRSGDRVRITGQLIDGQTGYHLWSDSYDRELTDVFAIQDEIAGAIAAQLEVTLGADEIGRAHV